MSVRILNAEPLGYSDAARRILRSVGELTERQPAQEDLPDAASGFDVLIVRVGLRVTRGVLDAARGLRAVATAATGLDHIDLEAAQEKGIAVLSLQGETEFLRSIPASAEHTWAILLALARQVPWAVAHVRDGGWDRDRFRGHDLSGKRLGILGLGRVGTKVAGYGRAFGMAVAAHDPCREHGWVEGVQRFDSLEDLLRWSEVLSVHLPLNDETTLLLNEERLRVLPQGAWLVNTARGAIIDEAALVALLDERWLAGAALDVLGVEQPPGDRDRSPLLHYARDHRNLLITPHVAGATVESMQETEVFIAQKIRSFLEAQGIVVGRHVGAAT